MIRVSDGADSRINWWIEKGRYRAPIVCGASAPQESERSAAWMVEWASFAYRVHQDSHCGPLHFACVLGKMYWNVLNIRGRCYWHAVKSVNGLARVRWPLCGLDTTTLALASTSVCSSMYARARRLHVRASERANIKNIQILNTLAFELILRHGLP